MEAAKGLPNLTGLVSVETSDDVVGKLEIPVPECASVQLMIRQ